MTAVVQGLGGALYEHCIYDQAADYLVPMAAEMPDIDVAHVETPTWASLLRQGRGRFGYRRCPTTQPITPEVILTALAKN